MFIYRFRRNIVCWTRLGRFESIRTCNLAWFYINFGEINLASPFFIMINVICRTYNFYILWLLLWIRRYYTCPRTQLVFDAVLGKLGNDLGTVILTILFVRNTNKLITCVYIIHITRGLDFYRYFNMIFSVFIYVVICIRLRERWINLVKTIEILILTIVPLGIDGTSCCVDTKVCDTKYFVPTCLASFEAYKLNLA